MRLGADHSERQAAPLAHHRGRLLDLHAPGGQSARQQRRAASAHHEPVGSTVEKGRPMSQLQVVSYSEVSTARQCLHKHHLAYQLRLRKPERQGTASARGTLFHSMLELHYQRIAAGFQPERAVYDLMDEWHHQGVTSFEDDDLLQWMYEGYIKHWGYDRQWRLVATEQRFELQLPPATGTGNVYGIKGMIDLVVLDKGRHWVVDHKTGRRSPAEKQLDMSDQFVVYAWALWQLGIEVEGCLHSWSNTQKNVHHEKQTLESRFKRTKMHRTQTEMLNAAQGLADSADLAWTTTHHPKSPSEDACKWCDYVDACMLGRRGGDEIHFLTAAGFKPAGRN